VTVLWSLEVVDTDVIVSVIEASNSRVELYTSRTAPREPVDRADYCSNVASVGHPHDEDVDGRPGIR
jgi:ATP:corrinoid adenosyltransferase